MNAVVDWTRTTGATELGLEVVADNQPAIDLYLRHGFSFTGDLGEPSADGRREARMIRRMHP